MKRLFITLLCAAALFGQEFVSRVVHLKHISTDSTKAVLDILAVEKVQWKTEGRLRIIALNGPAELVDAIEAAIGKLDVPAPAAKHIEPKNIELTFHMLLASPQGESPAIPADLAGVVQQLRNVFGLKSVRVLETAVLRGRDGKGGLTTGIMAPPGKVDAPATYLLGYDSAYVLTSEKGANVQIDKLRFNARLPSTTAGVQFYESSINTDIGIREGQKVVVGKTSIDSASQSIFLVVAAKVVD